MIKKRKEAIELCAALTLLCASAAATLRCTALPADAPSPKDRAALCAAAEAAGNRTVTHLCRTSAKLELIAQAYLCQRE